MYTDGGGATEQWRHTAGLGCAVASSTHGHTEAHLRLGQLRLDEHRAVEERGSTNNDAELRGLLEAAREASKLAHAFTAANANGVNTCSSKPRITIHTDSTYAILRAVGPTTRKRRHRDVTRMIREALAHARAVLGAGNVLIRKVRGHSGHAGNDIADELATEGRAGRALPQRLTVPQSQSGIPDLNETDEEGAHGLHTACWLRNRCKRTKTRPSATLVYPARVRIPAW